MSKAVVVSGEDSETESENEITDPEKTSTKKGTLKKGEDSESDDGDWMTSAVFALDQFDSSKSPRQKNYNSLLHKKLRDDNVLFHRNLENFCNNIINDCTNTLAMVDQQFVLSEVTLQNAVTSLKNLNVNSNTLTNKLQSMLSANFLPNVKLNK